MRTSVPGKQLALKQCLVSQGRNTSRGRVRWPPGGRAGAPSWNPAAPGAGPVVLPWQPTDLCPPSPERPQLPASWAQTFYVFLCVTTEGSPGQRETRAERENDEAEVTPWCQGRQEQALLAWFHW